MTSLEKARHIVRQGNCVGFSCEQSASGNKCPAYHVDCQLHENHVQPKSVEACKAYIKSLEGNMDKANAMARLDAIEREASELRKIIDGKMVYDEQKIYVGLYEGGPYIMTGRGESHGENFVFQRFKDRKALAKYTVPKKTGQDCLDLHAGHGFDIRAFDDTKEALQFFIDNL